MTKKPASPKSQSEQAEERRTRAKEARLEQAGTAVLEGKPGKAKKILAPKPETAADEHKKLVAMRAHRQKIRSCEEEMNRAKGEYKAAKDALEILNIELYRMIDDSQQAEFPFDGDETIKQELEGEAA
jgi:hypothetical protein